MTRCINYISFAPKSVGHVFNHKLQYKTIHNIISQKRQSDIKKRVNFLIRHNILYLQIFKIVNNQYNYNRDDKIID